MHDTESIRVLRSTRRIDGCCSCPAQTGGGLVDLDFGSLDQELDRDARELLHDCKGGSVSGEGGGSQGQTFGAHSSKELQVGLVLGGQDDQHHASAA